MKKIAIIKTGTGFGLAKIDIEDGSESAKVTILPRMKTGWPIVEKEIPLNLIAKMDPVYLTDDQLNDELKTILEG
jgi:hypothetical protein